MTFIELEKLLRERRSVRKFKRTPVSKSEVVRVLELARLAPSGANLQPGKFHVLTGDALDTLKSTLHEAVATERPYVSQYSYFPQPMPAVLKTKQRAAGYALYSALDINRCDTAGRREQFNQNYRFFDAPVGIVVTIHKDMGKGCFMDLGMAMMALFMAAQAGGYATTGIGALANFGDLIPTKLGLPDDELVVCGIALGIADDSAPVNQFRTDRDALESFSSFTGFKD